MLTADEILQRIERDESVHATLAGGATLHIDRPLPFLIVYREPAEKAGADAGTDRLIAGEASYVVISRDPDEGAVAIVRQIAEAGSARFGAFLVIEVWAGQAGATRFMVHAPPRQAAPESVQRLVEALQPVARLMPGVEVRVERSDRRHPADLPPLLTLEESWQGEILVIGLEVPPIYRDSDSGDVYPRFLRKLQHHFSKALRQAIHEFVRVQTRAPVDTYLALGTRTLPKRVWEIDRALVALERSFDLLLLVSPINQEQEWERFQARGHQENPAFSYRLLPMDPDLTKRRLYAIEMESIDDPAIADLFQEKRFELDTLLTMLYERGMPGFRYNSYRLYGTVDDDLLRVAVDLLATVEVPSRWTGEWVGAFEFRDAAERELAYYAARHPHTPKGAQIRRDIVGLMVSEGKLLIGENLRLRADRVEPLLHHEVGTHVLTYVNGSAQPLEQLSLGLADYDELQEGLAVLAEYLVGGLDALRMRLLAARVVAARSVEDGAEFIDTFRLLTGSYGYSPGGAWHIATRVHASGGFTRDLVYLRGLINLLRYLEGGGELEPLYLGKIAQKHVPVIEELRHREVLSKPALLPRWFEDPLSRDRLERVRHGIPLTEMICQQTG